jgi:ketosteroid isomerase-like protein
MGVWRMRSWTSITWVCISCALLFVYGAGTSSCQTMRQQKAAAIRDLLQSQQAAWNRGDIPAFMTGYWKSEKTEFVSSSGITRGWQSVLDRYLHSYPDRAAMGHLTFSDLEIHVLCPDAAYVVGHFHLDRKNDQPQGVFTLIFRKFPEGWRIINDHTSQFPASAGKSKPS